MREIKFRAWDHEDKKMWKVIAFSESIWGESEEPNITICDFGKDPTNYETEIRNSTNYELMQYTGLKDKNGQELYFDDYINFIYGHRRHTLVWGIRDLSDLTDLIYEIDERGANFEIVGNVHENPELSEEIR